MKVCEWYQWYPNDTLSCVMFYVFSGMKDGNDDKTRDFGHTGNWDGVMDWNGYPKMASSTGNMRLLWYPAWEYCPSQKRDQNGQEWDVDLPKLAFHFHPSSGFRVCGWKLMEPISWGWQPPSQPTSLKSYATSNWLPNCGASEGWPTTEVSPSGTGFGDSESAFWCFKRPNKCVQK